LKCRGGEPIKYEMEKDAGTLVVDRFLYNRHALSPGITASFRIRYRASDPCDVLVANTRAIVPGAVMSVRPVGVLLMEDEAAARENHRRASSKLTPSATTR